MQEKPIIRVYQGDLPDLNHYQNGAVAIDTETLGLNIGRDRLCVVQLSPGDNSADIVEIALGQKSAPNIVALLEDPLITKIFHYGRFDIAVLEHNFGCKINSVFCTKIASKFVRTYTDKHGLKALCSELLNISLSKGQQCSDWAHRPLTAEQIEYAAADVLYLHRLRDHLLQRLKREDRLLLAQACFDFLPIRARLDLAGWAEQCIFSHH